MNKITCILLLMLVGCTITKRVHTRGYYIDWHFNKQQNIKQFNVNPEELAADTTPINTPRNSAAIAMNEQDSAIFVINKPVHYIQPDAKTNSLNFPELKQHQPIKIADSKHLLKESRYRGSGRGSYWDNWFLSALYIFLIGIFCLIIGLILINLYYFKGYLWLLASIVAFITAFACLIIAIIDTIFIL